MVTMMLLAALTAQEPSLNHVRASAPKIRALMNTGLACSATFRRLVETLDQSDVIVYVEPKRTRQALGGYLAHSIVTASGYRYLRVAIDVHGADGRLWSSRFAKRVVDASRSDVDRAEILVQPGQDFSNQVRTGHQVGVAAVVPFEQFVLRAKRLEQQPLVASLGARRWR